MTVPPARQCSLPTCEREAADPSHGGALCEFHLQVTGSGEPVTEPEESPDSTTPEESPQDSDISGEAKTDRGHDNPIDVGDVTDEQRAAMLRDYLEAYVAEFSETPRLMPLDEEGKAPTIQGRCTLDSPEGRSHLVDGDEAIRQMRDEGARGFAIYAGKWDHATEDALFVDDDDPENFPRESFPPTLQVLTGSGRGTHDTYRNAGDVENAKGKDGVDGEVRAENWYCVVPGSIHPSGGVYHVTEKRDVATLANDDVPPELQPGSRHRDRERTAPDVEDLDGWGETPDESDTQERLEAAFNNSHDGDRIEQVYNGRYRAAGFDDRSSAEFWLANRLDSWIGLGDERRVERLMDRANLQKWPERPDRSYRKSILTNVGYQDWYYTDDENEDAGERKPVAPIALSRLEQLDGHQRDRFLAALPDGSLAPTTDQARDRLRDALYRELRAGNTTVLDAPTALGKSHTVATTSWLYREDLTGDIPVIQLHATRDARDEAMEATRESSASGAVLKGRKELCTVAGGDHDPADDPDEEDPEVVVTIDGQPASDWMDTMCDEKRLPFSMAHAIAAERNDQDLEALPCCADTGDCPAHAQWDDVPWKDLTHRCAVADHTVDECPDCRNDHVRFEAVGVDPIEERSGDRDADLVAGLEDVAIDEYTDHVRCELHDPDHTVEECPDCRDGSRPAVDVVHATHQLAHVPSLRSYTNVIVDEQPDFTVDFTDAGTPDADTGRIRSLVTAYLEEIDAPIATWEAFTTLARGESDDEDTPADTLDELLDVDAPTPDREWYVTEPHAHALAPDLTRAIWKALRSKDPDANGRRSKKVFHEPPRFDAGDGDTYAGTWLSVVIDESNTVRTVRVTPDFSNARSVIGLDAHPSMPMWRLNVDAGVTRDTILEGEERRLWRRYVRGLTVVQIGAGDDAATRPRSGEKAREWMHDERVRTLLETLRSHYGSDFRTAITPVQVERAVGNLLEDVAGDADTMHYGEEKSRNDFADEPAGYLYGCMDPGDDIILDALTELGLDAEPVTVDTKDGDTVREKGRTFAGPDADTADALLASVRENHVAQAAGRYARNPDDPDDHGTVYVDTDATPPGFADLEVPGVQWLAQPLQREIIDELVSRPAATTREIGDAVDCTKEHVRQTLTRLEEKGLVDRDHGAGDHGADVYHGDDATDAFVDLGETANDPLQDNSRASLAIHDRHASSRGDDAGRACGEGVATDGGRRHGGDPPPDDST